MITDPSQVDGRPSSTVAERMRASRKRRREGTHFVRIQLDRPDIDALIQLKLLRRARCDDNEAAEG